MECSVLMTITRPTPSGQRSLYKRGSERWKEPRSNGWLQRICFLNKIVQLHIGTHSHCGSMHKTCTSTSQIKILAWRRKMSMKFNLLLRSYWHLKVAGRSVTFLWVHGLWLVAHYIRWSHIQEYISSTNWTWGIYIKQS